MQTFQTVGHVGNGLIKANPDMFATGLASDQAIVTEALTTRATHVRVRTILMATRTAYGTSGADQCGLAAAGQHMVDAQMAATLAYATAGAFGLTGMAHIIPAD